MDVLKNKTYNQFDYLSRYSNVPFYYNTQDGRYIYGLGSNLNKNVDWLAHEVKQSDTLDKLALKYYNNPTLWWIIAYFNDIQDSLEPITDRKIIKIPSMNNLEFKSER